MTLAARRRRVRARNRLWRWAGALLWPFRLAAALNAFLVAEFHRSQE